MPNNMTDYKINVFDMCSHCHLCLHVFFLTKHYYYCIYCWVYGMMFWKSVSFTLTSKLSNLYYKPFPFHREMKF